MDHPPIDYRGLGYVGINAPAPEEWRDFGADVCGLMPSPLLPSPRDSMLSANTTARGLTEDGIAYLKMDDRQWRIAVHRDEVPGLRYLGIEVASRRALDAAAEVISKRGGDIQFAPAEVVSARAVGAMATVHDPAGHRLELFADPVRDKGFVSPHGMEFLTGELGMGHVVLYVHDAEECIRFYVDVLGFQRSDYMTFGPNGMGIHFLRCTRRHHTIALLQVGVPSGLQHLMLETTTLDDVGKCLDRAMQHRAVISSSLGRHRNDGTVSFYMNGPSGFDLEIGWDGVLVDDATWVEHEFAGGGDDWGHHGLAEATGLAKETE